MYVTIQNSLKELGLASKEIEVYLTLLKTGQASAAIVAKHSGLPRQTVYSLLGSLVEARFVDQSDKNGVRHFFADPNSLSKLINQKKESLDRNKKVLEEELPKFLAANKRGASFPVVQYYEGQQGIKRLFDEILDQHKRSKAKIFRGYGINQFYEGMEEYFRYFVEERYKYGVDTKLFIANAPDNFGIKDESTALGRAVKQLPIEEQQAGVYMVGNRVYLFSYKDNVGVMIENQAINSYLKEIFDILWSKS